MRGLFVFYVGGVPLGLKQSLSNGNEVQEVTELMRAFDAMKNSRSAIVLYVVERGGKSRLVAGIGEAPAEPMEWVLGTWGSVQYVFEVHEQVALMAVLIQLMYGLDYQMSLAELEKVGNKEGNPPPH